MDDQLELVQAGDWDTLIILDACRYDSFAETYEDYLPDGDLRKVRSPVDTRNNYATSDWCKKVFENGFEDAVYISGTARINSQMAVDGFDAAAHFREVVDVWDTGWDEDARVVPPDEVTAAAQAAAERVDRMIVHYVQPHFPFLSLDVRGPKEKVVPEDRETLKYRIRSTLGPRLRYLLGPQRMRSLGQLFNMPPLNYMDAVLREVGEEAIREAYADNLHRVLDETADLLDHLDGTAVVTADHGEMLGENNYYGHSYVPEHPQVVNVPWFETSV